MKYKFAQITLIINLNALFLAAKKIISQRNSDAVELTGPSERICLCLKWPLDDDDDDDELRRPSHMVESYNILIIYAD